MSDNIKIKARLKAFSKLNNTIKIDTEDVITDAPTSSTEIIYGRQNGEWVDIGEKFKLVDLANHQNEVDDSLISLDNKIDSSTSNLQDQITTEVNERKEAVDNLNAYINTVEDNLNNEISNRQEEDNQLNIKIASIKITVNEDNNEATFSGTLGTTETTTFRTGHNIDEKTIILNKNNQLQTNLNLISGEGKYSVSQKYQIDGNDYSAKATGENSAAFGGKRTGDKYKDDPTTQARGTQSFAAGASCEADGEASVAMGMEAEAYQRSAIAIGKACKSGLTIEEFNNIYATEAQKATAGYDNTKLNGGVEGLSIKDNHGDEYDTSYSMSFATGSNSEAAGWGAFVSGLANKSMADGAATFGNKNTNDGINAFVAGANNETSIPKTFLFGENLNQTKGDGLAFVIGSYNEDRGDYAFAVGSGNSDIERKNGFTINPSGQTYMNGAETESLPDTLPKAVINRTDLNKSLTSKSNATNWRNGNGAATVVTQEAGNSTGISKRTLIAGHSNKASNADGSSIVAGYGNDIASSSYSSILNGKFNTVTHDNCVVGGIGNETAANNQTIFGKYSALDSTSIFTVGNGTSEDNRYNVFIVTTDGRAVISNAPKNYNEAVRLLELNNIDDKYKSLTDSLKTDKLDKTGGTITGDLSIAGNLIVNGEQKVIETTSLKVNDPVIITNGSKTPLTTVLSGLAINTNEEDSYGIVYDNNKDAVELGLGKVSESGIFTFNENEGRPLAVRDNSNNLTNNNLVQISKEDNSITFKDSGKSINDFADASVSTNLQTHIDDKNNPHGVTKTQLGLDQVNNTADKDKPISNATQEALNVKLDKPTNINGTQIITATKESTGELITGTIGYQSTVTDEGSGANNLIQRDEYGYSYCLTESDIVREDGNSIINKGYAKRTWAPCAGYYYEVGGGSMEAGVSGDYIGYQTFTSESKTALQGTITNNLGRLSTESLPNSIVQRNSSGNIPLYTYNVKIDCGGADITMNYISPNYPSSLKNIVDTEGTVTIENISTLFSNLSKFYLTDVSYPIADSGNFTYPYVISPSISFNSSTSTIYVDGLFKISEDASISKMSRTSLTQLSNIRVYINQLGN